MCSVHTVIFTLIIRVKLKRHNLSNLTNRNVKHVYIIIQLKICLDKTSNFTTPALALGNRDGCGILETIHSHKVSFI